MGQCAGVLEEKKEAFRIEYEKLQLNASDGVIEALQDEQSKKKRNNKSLKGNDIEIWQENVEQKTKQLLDAEAELENRNSALEKLRNQMKEIRGHINEKESLKSREREKNGARDLEVEVRNLREKHQIILNQLDVIEAKKLRIENQLKKLSLVERKNENSA